jgi:hypothetical protein
MSPGPARHSVRQEDATPGDDVGPHGLGSACPRMWTASSLVPSSPRAAAAEAPQRSDEPHVADRVSDLAAPARFEVGDQVESSLVVGAVMGAA